MATKVVKVDAVELKAKRFVEVFYHYLDSNRVNLAGMYMANSVKIWNGNAISGAPSITAFYQNTLKTTRHEIECLNAHEVLVSNESTGISITIHGKVSIGFHKEVRFVQSLFIEKDRSRTDKNYMIIVSDVVRTSEF